MTDSVIRQPKTLAHQWKIYWNVIYLFVYDSIIENPLVLPQV